MRCPNSINNRVFVDKKLVSEKAQMILCMSLCPKHETRELNRKGSPGSLLAAQATPGGEPYLCISVLCACSFQVAATSLTQDSGRCCSAVLIGSVFSPGRRQMAAQGNPTQDICSHKASLRGSQV